MNTLAKADLETLLRAKKFGNTLFSDVSHSKPSGLALAPTGVEALDAELGGGLPRGQLSEIVGPRSSGRTSILCALLSAATARGEPVALVDTLDTFDPESGAAAGIDLSRLLWIRGRACSRHEALARALDHALKALGLLLQAGGFGVVALDLADVPPGALRRIPFTTWMRLPRAIEGRMTAGLLLGAVSMTRSAGGMTLALRAVGDAGRWSGDADRARLFLGLDIDARVICARRPRDSYARQSFVSVATCH